MKYFFLIIVLALSTTPAAADTLPLHFETHVRKITGAAPSKQQCDELAAIVRGKAGKNEVKTAFQKVELSHIYNPGDYAGDNAPWNVTAEGDMDIQNQFDLAGTSCHITASISGEDSNLDVPENLLADGREIMSADGCGLSGGTLTTANAKYVCQQEHRGVCLKENPQCCGDDDPGCDNCADIEWDYTYDCFALPPEFKAPSKQLKTPFTVENKYDRQLK